MIVEFASKSAFSDAAAKARQQEDLHFQAAVLDQQWSCCRVSHIVGCDHEDSALPGAGIA
jgi:hypothetical protein